MTILLPADRLTHVIAGACVALVALPFGPEWAAGACAVAAVAREVYGCWHRGWTLTRADAIESAGDIASTLAGGAIVLASAFIGV